MQNEKEKDVHGNSNLNQQQHKQSAYYHKANRMFNQIVFPPEVLANLKLKEDKKWTD